uniref:Uncharacterized protein n=1 Tax=Anguilla anguilla TaxID=7936 RepID=A0A0E9PB42_ANGAN
MGHPLISSTKPENINTNKYNQIQ